MGLGTMNFGGRTDEETAVAILDRAVERGVNLIDTANVYGHDPADFEAGRGRCEEILGRWLAGRDRDELVVATKMFFPMRGGPGAAGSSRRNVIRECEASLRRLGIDVIDIYQLHHPSNDVPIDETLSALDDLVRAGKVRHVGTSTFGAWQIVEALWAADVKGYRRLVSEQPVYNILDRRVERELAPMAQTYDVALLTWSPLAGGALSGAYRRSEPAPGGSRFEVFWRGRERDMDATTFDVLEAVERLAAGVGRSPAQLAHAWVASRPEPTSVLIGPRTIAQLDDALDACEQRLGDDVMAEVDRLSPPGRVVLPQYGSDGLAWHAWGPHRRRWR